MKLWLQLAWRNLWRQRRRSLITASAMAVGVGLSMSLICLNDGTFSKFFEVMVEIHGAVVEGDQKRGLGRIATVYKFIEQYTVDQGDMSVAALATQMPPWRHTCRIRTGT